MFHWPQDFPSLFITRCSYHRGLLHGTSRALHGRHNIQCKQRKDSAYHAANNTAMHPTLHNGLARRAFYQTAGHRGLRSPIKSTLFRHQRQQFREALQHLIAPAEVPRATEGSFRGLSLPKSMILQSRDARQTEAKAASIRIQGLAVCSITSQLSQDPHSVLLTMSCPAASTKPRPEVMEVVPTSLLQEQLRAAAKVRMASRIKAKVARHRPPSTEAGLPRRTGDGRAQYLQARIRKDLRQQ